MVGPGLLECRLAVLADHHEGGKENRLQRYHQRQRRPGASFQHNHPDAEQRRMNPDEVHRAGERRYPIRQAELKIRTSPFGLVQHGGVMNLSTSQEPARNELRGMPMAFGLCRHVEPFLSMPIGRGRIIRGDSPGGRCGPESPELPATRPQTEPGRYWRPATSGQWSTSRRTR